MRGRSMTFAAVVALLLALSVTGCGEKKICVAPMEDSPIPFAMIAFDGTIEYANPAYRQLLGYTEEEVRRVNALELTPLKWRDVEKAYVEAAADLPFVRYEKEYVGKAGTSIPIEVTAWVVKDAGGKPASIAALVIDLTESLKAEKLEQMMGLGTE